MPDFYYSEGRVCVFLDGTPHDQPSVSGKDAENDKILRAKQFQVLRLRYNQDMLAFIRKNAQVFSPARC